MAKARKVRGWRRAAVPWAALFGLVLPSSPRPAAFSPSCALRVAAFQAPKEDAGDTRATLGPTRERFPALQHKRPWTAAARMLAMTAGSGSEVLGGGGSGVQHVTAWSKAVRNAMLRGGAEHQVQRVLDRAGSNWNKNFPLFTEAGRQNIRQSASEGVQSELMGAKDWGRRCMTQLQEDGYESVAEAVGADHCPPKPKKEKKDD